MSSISPIEASIYTGLIENIDFQPRSRSSNSDTASSDSSSSVDLSGVDLSKYYANVHPEDIVAQAGENVQKAAEELDKAIVSALENGFGINDAINIQLAKNAYEANCKVLKTTFELSI